MTIQDFDPIELRRLWRSDMGVFRNHLLRLNAASRHDRFGASVSNDFIANYADSCFGSRDLVYGAFVENNLRGVGELRSTRAVWRELTPFALNISGEAAFSVEDGWRQRGVGEALFARIERAAGNHGVETIEIFCAWDNIAMLRLAAKFATKFVFEQDQSMGRLTARRPTAFSLWREASRDVGDYASSMLDLQARLAAKCGQARK